MMTSLLGYNKHIELIRDDEFVSTQDVTYLDHAGTTLVAKKQLDAHHGDILHNLYGNPHSRCPSSQLTTDTIDQARYRLLQYFHASPAEYSVIFTAGCTASLKLVAESFDFHCNGCHRVDDTSDTTLCSCESNKCSTSCNETHSCHGNISKGNDCQGEYDISDTTACESESEKHSSSCNETHGCHGNSQRLRLGSFVYLADNHTSVQGMRELAFERAGKVTCVSCDDHNQSFTANCLYQHATFQDGGNHLFVFPAQSNFSGRKYPLHWLSMVKDGSMGFQRSIQGQRSGCDQGRWYTLLDAAALVGTSRLDLGHHKPDFVSLSFYKMFGYPTGLGALLVRNESSHVLRKRYFGGGSVAASLPRERFHIPRPALCDRFEDGTVSFLDIVALRHGFDALETIAGGIVNISQHTFFLATYFYNHLTSCCHGNGQPLAEIYCVGDFRDPETQGPIVNFNLRRASGDYIGFSEVDKLAQVHGVHMRTGCFCNIGACQHFLHITDSQVRDNFHAGHVCGDDRDLINGRPTGSVRASFGYMSVLMDAQKCLQSIVDCFLESPVKPVFWGKQTWTQSTIVDANKFENLSQSNNLSNEVSVTNKLEHNPQTSKSNDIINKDIRNAAISEHFGEDKPKKTSIDMSSSHGENCTNLSNHLHKTSHDVAADSQRVPVTEEAWNHRLESNRSGEIAPGNNSQGRQLTDIFVYPVKSCAAFKVSQWEVSPRGLLYDHEWMVVTGGGTALSQKREPALCLVQPSIQHDRGSLVLQYPGMKRCIVPLSIDETKVGEASLCNSKVCGDRVDSVDCGEEVSDWLSEALHRPGCRLIRQQVNDRRESKLNKRLHGDVPQTGPLSLANESQYLLLHRASIRRLHDKIVDRREAGEIFETHELVYWDLHWRETSFTYRTAVCLYPTPCRQLLSVGLCTRCQMVCVDQETAERSKEPLKTLAVWRGTKIPFGIHLYCSGIDADGPLTLHVGDPITVLS